MNFRIKQRADLYRSDQFLTLGDLRQFLEAVEGYPADAQLWVGNGDGDDQDQHTHRLDYIIVETRGDLT